MLVVSKVEPVILKCKLMCVLYYQSTLLNHWWPAKTTMGLYVTLTVVEVLVSGRIHPQLLTNR